MAVIIGHGFFAEYECQLIINGTMPFSEIIEALEIPRNLREALVPIIGSKIIDDDYQVNNDDEIHLFLLVSGG